MPVAQSSRPVLAVRYTLCNLSCPAHVAQHASLCAGETYLVLDRSLGEVVRHMARPLATNIRVNWPVYRVQYSASGATLTGPSGQKLRCRHLVLTVPLLILQRNYITFQPPLPPQKLGAISRVKMSNAVKVSSCLPLLSPSRFGIHDLHCPNDLHLPNQIHLLDYHVEPDRQRQQCSSYLSTLYIGYSNGRWENVPEMCCSKVPNIEDICRASAAWFCR